MRSSFNEKSINTQFIGDRFLLFCLLISVTFIFFQWYEIYMAIPMLLVLLGKHHSHQCKKHTFWLFVFAIVYLAINSLHGLIGARSFYIIYLFPPVFFMAGSYFGGKYKNNENALLVIMFLTICMYAAYDFIYLTNSVLHNETAVIAERRIYDNNDEIARAATGYALILSLFIAGLSLILTPKQNGTLKWIKVSSIVLGAIAVFDMAKIVTRTSIVELFVILAFSIIMILRERNLKRGGQSVLVGFLLLIIVAFIIINNSDFYAVVSAYEDREVNEYAAGTVGGRSALWLDALKLIIDHPLGTLSGRVTSTGGHAHNMWLDVGVKGGWLPLIILLIILVRNIIQSFKLLNNKEYGYFTRLYFFSLFIVFMMGCFVEPVLDSVYNHFLVYLFFCGMVSEMYNKQPVMMSDL